MGKGGGSCAGWRGPVGGDANANPRSISASATSNGSIGINSALVLPFFVVLSVWLLLVLMPLVFLMTLVVVLMLLVMLVTREPVFGTQLAPAAMWSLEAEELAETKR